MEQFESKVIIELENLLSSKRIQILKSDFIKKNLSKEDPPLDIDSQKGVLYFYNSHDDYQYEIKFEDYLSKILFQKTNQLKSEIQDSNILLSNGEKKRYWQSILETFKYTQDCNQDTYDLFPVCYKPNEVIQKYLNNKYQYNPISQFEGSSYFTLKPKYSLNDLKKIFEFLTDELFLDDEIYSFDDFTSVFNDLDTKIYLSFNCETSIIIRILDKIIPLFTDLTIKRIEESGRFLTKKTDNKPSKPITTSIYYTNRNRGNKPQIINNIRKIENFFSSNFPI